MNKVLDISVSPNPIELLVKSSDSWMIYKDMVKKMNRIVGWGKNLNNVKGKLGELYVRFNIRYTLQKNGYKERHCTDPKTFTLIPLYRGYKGIDIYLRVTDKDNKTYRAFIEISNWGKYHDINEYLFNTRILAKFNRFDKNHKYIHILCMNKRNSKLVEDYCKKNDILLIPLREHITPSLLKTLIERKEITT